MRKTWGGDLGWKGEVALQSGAWYWRHLDTDAKKELERDGKGEGGERLLWPQRGGLELGQSEISTFPSGKTGKRRKGGMGTGAEYSGWNLLGYEVKKREAGLTV